MSTYVTTESAQWSSATESCDSTSVTRILNHTRLPLPEQSIYVVAGIVKEHVAGRYESPTPICGHHRAQAFVRSVGKVTSVGGADFSRSRYKEITTWKPATNWLEMLLKNPGWDYRRGRTGKIMHSLEQEHAEQPNDAQDSSYDLSESSDTVP